MIIFREANSLSNYLASCKRKGSVIGFIPTMGALHQGHISLVKTSLSQHWLTVSSIFINPTQFNDQNDFKKYPITIDRDIHALEVAGCHVLFLPDIHEIYPNGTSQVKYFELGPLEQILEGKYRPGHFQGVCQVVERLLQITEPDHLYMGQKDYQQCMVVNKLIELMNVPIKMHISPTTRADSGLALSSRNTRLSVEEQMKASMIYQLLLAIKNEYSSTSIGDLQTKTLACLQQNGFAKVDYVSIANALTLQPVPDAEKPEIAIALVAAYMGDVRLIDNMLL